MDPCTASTVRWILMLVVVAMAAAGLWSAAGTYGCAKVDNDADKRRCTIKTAGITAAVVAAGLFLTTLVIVRADRVALQAPSTTDLMQNIA